MKLKSSLRLAFVFLTLVPIMIVSVLLYKSGFELSKKTYENNLQESINVQGDYISQTIESDMVYNKRFAKKTLNDYHNNKDQKKLREAFITYLDVAEDKITASIMMDKNNQVIYSTGETTAVDQIYGQLADKLQDDKQKISEFTLYEDSYRLGIITPVWSDNEFLGSMISIYDESFILKIISTYYDISETATYIYRENGQAIHYTGQFLEEADSNVDLGTIFSDDLVGKIETKLNRENTFGYYKAIGNSPWFLVILAKDSLIFDFTNQFIYIYIVIIGIIFVIDILLALYFSDRVVKPIRSLIMVMDEYQNDLDKVILDTEQDVGYYETRYLRKKFFELMNKVSLVQHNFKGIYQLYQSNDMGDINTDIDVKTQKIYSNKDAFTELLDSIELSAEDCVVENFVKCFCEEDEVRLRDVFVNMRDEQLAKEVELDVYTPHLGQRWFHVMVVPLYEDVRLSRLFIQLRDISSFKKQEIESSKKAKLDPLTGLYNRRGLLDYIESVSKSNERYGLLFADMNDFKKVNDYFGHEEGDRLLVQIGHDLLGITGGHGVVTRLGGDEFLILYQGATADMLEEMKAVIQKQLQYKYEKQGVSFTVSASIGEAVWDSNSAASFEEILRKADESMYEEKRRFKTTN